MALPVPVRQTFIYRVPDGTGNVEPGSRAVVPFGRRSLTGVIASLAEKTDLDPSRIKDALSLPDAAPSIARPLLGTLLWAARYYVAPPGPMLVSAIPAGSARRGSAEPGESELFYALAVELASALASCSRAPRQRQLIEALTGSGEPLSASVLRGRFGEVGPILTALRKKKIVSVEKRAVARPPHVLPASGKPTRHSLTAEQSAAVRAVTDAAAARVTAGFLLMGPTGSGKTEVYLSAIEAILAQGRPAIYLVPEISLTPILARTIKSRFGESFALLHSSLTQGQRLTEWRRARDGSARVVLGPRSALLAPLLSPGIIVVDEEQDSSFKQEKDPRYNARDLALVRAREEGAVTLLGSATPSLEAFRLAEMKKLQLLTLSQRIEARPLSQVELIDMRAEEDRTGGDEPISKRLREELRGCLERREQAIVFLNRRGWAPAVLCRRCGENVTCSRCSIALTWHRVDRRLLCHYCGYHRGMPESCPTCGAPNLLLAGAGTERLTAEIAELFPGARLARLDRDVARGRAEPGRILATFERGEFDILVGTQLVAKGHDFPNVTLVGVVGADFTLGFPDFRAAERTFQILTQVAGRAGRGEKPGRVIVQAFRPDHYAIQCAAAQDYSAFYPKEARYRRLMGYPPFTAMANVIASAMTLEAGQRRARAAADAIRAAGGNDLRILGPAIAPLARLKGKYRFQIMIRCNNRRRLSDALNAAVDHLEGAPSGARDLVIDVDPASLL